MNRFKTTFKVAKPIIGMIHVDALPGTPKYKGNTKSIIQKVIKKAKVYSENSLIPHNPRSKDPGDQLLFIPGRFG